MNETGLLKDQFDVAIVGYGPTGMALAYWLGSAGHNVVVLERWPDLYALPRAGHVDGEIMRLFQRMKMADEILSDSVVTTHTVIRDSDGEVMTTLPVSTCDQGWDAHYSLYQPNLERALDSRVRESGNVTVLQGWQVAGIERADDGRVTLTAHAGRADNGTWHPLGATRTVSAQWLIGADGANSVVADFVGGESEDLGYSARALVIFAERLDSSVGSTMPDNEVGMIPSRPYVAFRSSGKRFARWEFHVHDNEDTAEMVSADTAWKMIEPWGFTAENSRLVRHTVFEFRTLIGRSWRDGNVLLAGDAAHRMPPFQGQGMCSGQRDAAALAWRLDLVLRGVADDSILDSYTDERRPHVRELTVNAAERGRRFWLTNPEKARRRDEQMRQNFQSDNFRVSYGPVPALTDGVLMRDNGNVLAPAGALSPQFRVGYDDRELLHDDLVSAGWALIVSDPSLLDTLAPASRDLLEALDVYTWASGGDRSAGRPVDTQGGYTRWLNEIGCRAVLVRPDSYVFGGATDPAGLEQLLAALHQQLHLKEALV